MEASALTTPSSVSGLRGPSPLLRLQSDERLIALTRRGHNAAFETLCSRYQSRLLSFCRHMLGSREDAEDVLQEVFAAAFNAVLADERAINVRPWLYRIARNRSLNHLRRNSATGVDSMDVFLSEGGISTGEKVLRREGFRELIGDVHGLPETQRTALLLREIDALSYEQIAQAMDTTVPSVKSLLVRARISLAEAAEARKLSCDEVRLELGQAAEGLLKLSTPARRHVRGCDRCASFKRQLKDNNKALAAIFPVGPLLLAKKLLFAKLGSTASAGGAHVGAASVGASATAGAPPPPAGAAAGGGKRRRRADDSRSRRARHEGRRRPRGGRDRHRRRCRRRPLRQPSPPSAERHLRERSRPPRGHRAADRGPAGSADQPQGPRPSTAPRRRWQNAAPTSRRRPSCSPSPPPRPRARRPRP